MSDPETMRYSVLSVVKPTLFGSDGFISPADVRIVQRAFAPDSFKVDTDEHAGPGVARCRDPASL